MKAFPRDEVEELAVSSHGMEEVGRRCEIPGDYVTEPVVQGWDASLRWSKMADDKPLKSVPAAVKNDHADEVKELQAVLKDVGKMLTVQREHTDGLFLSRKTWTFDAWRERYPDHPLAGAIARRLLWRFETWGKTVDCLWLDDRLVEVDDQPHAGFGDGTTVSPGHPIGRTVEEVTVWRDWLDRHQVRSP